MTTTGNGPAQSTKRRTAFRVISTLWAASGIAFGVFTALFAVLDEGQEIHAIHNAVVTALLLVLSAPAAVAAARAPERSTRPLVHLSAVGIAGLITMALSLTLDPFTLPLVILVGVLWALRPSREEPIASVSPSPILLVFVAAAAGPLVAYALGQAELQRIDDVSEHAEFFHWVETSFYAVAILLLGLLAALRPAAHRFSGWAAGAALAVLGVASLALRGRPSGLDTGWAWAAVVGSLVFLAAVEWESRRRTRPVPG
jgi:hypothetical protein